MSCQGQVWLVSFWPGVRTMDCEPSPPALHSCNGLEQRFEVRAHAASINLIKPGNQILVCFYLVWSASELPQHWYSPQCRNRINQLMLMAENQPSGPSRAYFEQSLLRMVRMAALCHQVSRRSHKCASPSILLHPSSKLNWRSMRPSRGLTQPCWKVSSGNTLCCPSTRTKHTRQVWNNDHSS